MESEKDLTRNDLRSALYGPFRDNCIEISLALGDGEVYKFKMWKPHKQVEHLLAQNPDFEDLIDEALRLHPPTMRNPWRILVGWDEMVPGNPLSETGRKLMVLSWTFYELPNGLSNTTAWLTPLMLRCAAMNVAEGKFSGVLRQLLEHLLFDTVSGYHCSGHTIRVKGRIVTIFALLTRLFADGGGFAQGL